MTSGSPDFTGARKAYVQKWFLPIIDTINSTISSSRDNILGGGNLITNLAIGQAYYRQISSFIVYSEGGAVVGLVQYSDDGGLNWYDCCKAASSGAYIQAFEDFTEGAILQPNWLLRVRLYNIAAGAAWIHHVLNYTWEQG